MSKCVKFLCTDSDTLDFRQFSLCILAKKKVLLIYPLKFSSSPVANVFTSGSVIYSLVSFFPTVRLVMSTSVLKIKLSYFMGSSSYRHSSTELWQYITHLLLGCRTEQFKQITLMGIFQIFIY